MPQGQSECKDEGEEEGEGEGEEENEGNCERWGLLDSGLRGIWR